MKASATIHPELAKAFREAPASDQIFAITGIVAACASLDGRDVREFLVTDGQRKAWRKMITNREDQTQ